MKNILEKIVDLIKRYSHKKVITKETTFNELGFDSLDSVELLIDCEKEFSITIPDEEWAVVEKVEDVVNIILKYAKI